MMSFVDVCKYKLHDTRDKSSRLTAFRVATSFVAKKEGTTALPAKYTLSSYCYCYKAFQAVKDILRGSHGKASIIRDTPTLVLALTHARHTARQACMHISPP